MKPSDSIPKRVVIPDTNSLWTEKPDFVVASGFMAALEQCRELGDVVLYVPEVVVGEIAFQRFVTLAEAVENAKKNFATVEKILAKRFPTGLNAEELKADLIEHVRAEFKKLEATIAETPVERIDIKQLQNDSIWRQPPFTKEKHEKGFRDRLIAETSFGIAEKHPEKSVVLLTKDSALKEFIRSRSTTCRNLSTSDSLEDILSELRLQSGHMAQEIAKSLVEDAKQTFCDLGSKTGLFYEANIEASIEKKFASIFPLFETVKMPPPFGDSIFSRSDESNVSVGQTTFVQRKGKEKYSWETSIYVRRVYKRFGDVGIGQQLPHVMKVVFSARWVAELDSHGKLFAAKLQELSHLKAEPDGLGWLAFWKERSSSPQYPLSTLVSGLGGQDTKAPPNADWGTAFSTFLKKNE